MIFGHIQRFAIEMELNENMGGDWLFGRVGYWLSDRQIGDFELGDSLRDVLFSMETVAQYTGRRGNKAFLTMSAKDLSSTLSDALYGNPNVDAVTERRAIDEEWIRHCVLPNTDVFNGWHLYLVEDAEVGRCIAYHPPDESYWEAVLTKGEFDAVQQSAIDYLNSLR